MKNESSSMKPQNTLCTLSIAPDYLTCALFSRTGNDLFLHAYEHNPLKKLVIINGRLFNPSLIKKYITSFARKNNLRNTPTNIALAAASIQELFIPSTSITPSDEQLMPSTPKNTVWHHTFLYPSSSGRFMFYVCGIAHPILLQYTLIALQSPLNLMSVTSQTMARLLAYKKLYKDTFRHSQLGMNIEALNGAIEQLVDKEMAFRMIHIAPNAQLPNQIDPHHLITHIGLAST